MADQSKGLDTPAITKEDALVFVGVAAAVASLFGFDMTGAQQAAISGAIVTAWGVAQLIAGAIRRHGRAQIAAAAITAGSEPGAILKSLPDPTPEPKA